MKKIIHETSTALLQVSHSDVTNSISLEQFSKLSNGGHFNTGRISLSLEEVQAVIKYYEEIASNDSKIT